MLRGLVGERSTLAIALILFILLSACIDNERIQFYRQKCLSLTSHDVANIPSCKSQERCFELVQKKLFDFPQESLPFESQRLLYHYQNHLAKSWFYYNAVVEDSKEIQELCSQERFDDITSKVNDLRYDIEKAFEEADNAMNVSFAFILSEKIDLETQDINLMKEEPLYALYIKLSDNERQIRTAELLALNNYASHSRALAEKMRKRKLFRGADIRIIKKQTLGESLLSFISLGLLNMGKLTANDTEIFIPVLSEALSYFVDFIEEAETLDRALSYMEEMPPNEFLSMLSDVVAEQDSLASEFSELVKQDSLQRAFLEEELNGIEQELSKKLDSIAELSEFFQQDAFQYADTNFLARLQALLDEPLAFSFKSLYFSSPASAHARAKPELVLLSIELQQIKNAYISGKTTIGHRTQKLKELNLKADKILNSLKILKESFYALLDKCNKKAQTLELSEYDAETSFELMQLKDAFLNAKDSSKLLYCAKLVEKEALAKERTLLKEKNEAILSNSSCYAKLSALMPFVKDSALIEQYNSLSDLNSDLENHCNNLLLLVQEHLRNEYEIADLEKKFGEIKMLRAFMENYDYVEGTKFYSLSAFFTGNSLILEKALPEINSLRYEINKLYFETKEEAKRFLAEHIVSNYSLTSLPDSLIELSYDEPKQSVASKYLLAFENPFFEVAEPFTVMLPLKFSSCDIITKTPNVSALQCGGKNLTISLYSLPLGKTLIEFSSAQEIELKKRNSKIMLSSEVAKIIEQYEVASQAKIPKLKLLLQDLNGYATMIFRNKSVPLIKQGDYLVAFLNEVEPNERFAVSYAILDPVEISLELIDEQRDSNKAFLDYICIVKSKIPYAAKDVVIFLPLPANNVENAKAYDEFGKDISLKLSGKRIEAIIKELGAYERKRFYLQLTISDYSLFKNKLIKDTKALLRDLLASNELSSEANELLSDLEQLGSEAGLEKLQDTYKKALELKNRKETILIFKERYNFFKGALKSRIDTLKETMQQAKQLGMAELAASLQEKLSNAEKALAEAEKLFGTNKEKAIELIENAIAALSDLQENETAKLFKEQAEQLIEQANAFAKLLTKTGLKDANTAKLMKLAMQSYENACRLISEAELLEAKNNIVTLQHSLADLNSYFESSLERRIANIASGLDFVERFRNSFASRLSSLEKQLASVTKTQLVDARYLPSFDQHLLSELAEQAELTNDPLWKKLKALLAENLLIEAAELANAEHFDEKLSMLRALDVRVIQLGDKLKEEALYYVQLLEKSASDKALSTLKKQAREELLKENYLKAIVIAKAGLASLPETENSSAFYAALFALSALAIAAVAKLKRNKKEKPTFRRVLRNPNSL